MRLSDLQDKDVIDLKTGIKVGNIIDIKIQVDGIVSSLILEKKRFSKLFSPNDEIDVPFNKIVKIGEDVILIKDM
ncbi:MAG: YlmC/YmxH family sporulation protein [Bacilli bacterium]|nr:YlmC/YmxH family sporulation protein [Bacilli bacterium]